MAKTVSARIDCVASVMIFEFMEVTSPNVQVSSHDRHGPGGQLCFWKLLCWQPSRHWILSVAFVPEPYAPNPAASDARTCADKTYESGPPVPQPSPSMPASSMEPKRSAMHSTMGVVLLVVGLSSNEFEVWAIDHNSTLQQAVPDHSVRGTASAAATRYEDTAEQLQRQQQQQIARCLTRVRCSQRLLLYCMDLVIERASAGHVASTDQGGSDQESSCSALKSGYGGFESSAGAIVIRAASGTYAGGLWPGSQSRSLTAVNQDLMRRTTIC
jgi:hypothetical protein